LALSKIRILRSFRS